MACLDWFPPGKVGNGLPGNLSRAGLWQSWHTSGQSEGRHRSHIHANQFEDLPFDLIQGSAYIILEYKEGKRNLSLNLVRNPHDRAICDIRMLHDGLFYLEGRKAVPRHVYDIVISGEDADVPILVPNTDVHCVVVALS